MKYTIKSRIVAIHNISPSADGEHTEAILTIDNYTISKPQSIIGTYIELNRSDKPPWFTSIIEVFLIFNNTLYEIADNLLVNINNNSKFTMKLLDRATIDPYLEGAIEKAEQLAIEGSAWPHV